MIRYKFVKCGAVSIRELLTCFLRLACLVFQDKIKRHLLVKIPMAKNSFWWWYTCMSCFIIWWLLVVIRYKFFKCGVVSIRGLLTCFWRLIWFVQSFKKNQKANYWWKFVRPKTKIFLQHLVVIHMHVTFHCLIIIGCSIIDLGI